MKKTSTKGFVAVLGTVVLGLVGCAEATNEGTTTAAAGVTWVIPAPRGLAISQIYSGGGRDDAAFRSDFIEILNQSHQAVSLDGLSLQYAPADEDWSASQRVIPLDNVSVPRNHYYLIRLGSHGPSGSEVLSYDQLALGTSGVPGETGHFLGEGGGRVALVKSTALLDGCGSVGRPCPDRSAIDLVGYGGASQYEGDGPSLAPFATDSLQRKCPEIDYNQNKYDFFVAPPVLRTLASPPTPSTIELCPAILL